MSKWCWWKDGILVVYRALYINNSLSLLYLPFYVFAVNELMGLNLIAIYWVFKNRPIYICDVIKQSESELASIDF